MTEAEELELLELEELESQAKKPGKAEIAARGAASGLTFGFADELTSVLETMFPILKTTAGDIAQGQTRSAPSTYEQNRAENRQLHEEARAADPALYTGSEVAAGFITPGGAAKTAATQIGKVGLKQALKAGAKAGLRQGAAYGLGTSEADLAGGDVLGAARDTALGGAIGGALGGTLGAGGHVLSKALAKGGGKLRDYAAGKVAAVEQQVADTTAKEAASVTASARSAAGHAAQDAYKQLEHLREPGRTGRLSPEQMQAMQDLSQELAEKAQEKLLPAAARKAETARLYKEALESEGARAAQLAKEKLGAGELKQQLGARFKRYALPAIGGAALAGATGADSPMELLSGAGLGALGGAGMRPMMHSLLRMAKQPAVQQRAWKALQKTGAAASGAAPALQGAAVKLSRNPGPQRALANELRPSFAESETLEEERMRMLVEALRASSQ